MNLCAHAILDNRVTWEVAWSCKPSPAEVIAKRRRMDRNEENTPHCLSTIPSLISTKPRTSGLPTAAADLMHLRVLGASALLSECRPQSVNLKVDLHGDLHRRRRVKDRVVGWIVGVSCILSCLHR